jgi:hypothetical protein
MSRSLAPLLAGSLAMLVASSAMAASHPPGVPYPLKPAALQPSGLAQPLPSTRRYVLVWKDQLADAVQGVTAAQKDWLVEHYVGTQKLFRHQIDEYRAKNPGFLYLVYHLAYGLNGADQSSPVGNITGPEKWGQEDTDTFTPWIGAHAVTRENLYQHANGSGPSHRVSTSDPAWLMDIASPDWRAYLFDTLVAWAAFPTTRATGIFLDVAFHPWYSYQPNAWWSSYAGGSSHQALATWWNPRAKSYFDAMRAALAPGASHPRYLVIPNPDALVDEEPEFLDSTDGAFTENWQNAMDSTGDWQVSARRVCRYVTSKQKTWIIGVTASGTSLPNARRELLVGSYLLLRNGTSYFMLGLDDVTWYPEYEIDLGGYEAEPPEDLEALRVAGTGGGSGGLYARKYVSGLVLVNSSGGSLSTTLSKAMKRAAFSGGGNVSGSGVMAAQSLSYTADVGPGQVQVPARSAMVLRDPAGAPPPGVEPGDAPDAGTDGGGGSAGSGGTGGSGGSAGGAGGAGTGGTAGTAGTGAAGGAAGTAGKGGAGTGGSAGASKDGGLDAAAGSSAAGTAGTGASGSAGAQGAAADAPQSADEGGCGCRTRRGGGVSFGAWAAAILAGWLARRARRRR